MGVSVTLEDYNKVFEILVQELVVESPLADGMPEAMARFEKLIRYNIPHWTEIRGYIVATTYAELLGDCLTDEKRHLSYVLGWCWQMIQGCMGLLDDFFDDDDSRFGKPTWFRVDGNARVGVNDVIILEHGVYRLILKYFGNSPLHSKILDYFSSFLYETALAQGSEYELNSHPDKAQCTMAKYKQYTMHLNKKVCGFGNIELAYILAEIPKPIKILADVEVIFDEFSYFYTLRNDYNDSFLENVSCDNDIKTGKWKWLAIKAKEMCTKHQWATLMGSYGKDNTEAVNNVKEIYKDLGLPEICGEELLALGRNLESKVAAITKEAPGIGNIIMNLLKWYRLSLE